MTVPTINATLFLLFSLLITITSMIITSVVIMIDVWRILAEDALPW